MSLKPITINEWERYFKVCLYGKQGTGKTRWTAENVPKPAVWIDFEKSYDTIAEAGIEGIDVVPIKPGVDPKEIKRFCLEIEKSKYKTIVFDTISTAQTFQLTEWMQKQNHELPLFQDFRMSTHIFNDIFFGLQHANVHVVLIAHEREIWEGELPNRRKIAVGPSITPALHDSVTQLVSGVLRLQKKPSMRAGEKPTWSMLCNEKDKFIAKNRFGITDVTVENPTWDTFMKGIDNA